MSWSLRPTSARSPVNCTSLPSLKISLPQGVVGAVAGWLTGFATIGLRAGIVCDDGDTPVWIVGGCAGGVYTGVGGLGGCLGAVVVSGFGLPGIYVTEGFGVTGGCCGTGGTYGCGCGMGCLGAGGV